MLTPQSTPSHSGSRAFTLLQCEVISAAHMHSARPSLSTSGSSARTTSTRVPQETCSVPNPGEWNSVQDKGTCTPGFEKPVGGNNGVGELDSVHRDSEEPKSCRRGQEPAAEGQGGGAVGVSERGEMGRKETPGGRKQAGRSQVVHLLGKWICPP